MPCGGIEPLSNPLAGKCWVCQKDDPKPQHFCFEWDTWIHARCVPQFLTEDEGKIVISHGHLVVLDFALETENGESTARTSSV